MVLHPLNTYRQSAQDRARSFLQSNGFADIGKDEFTGTLATTAGGPIPAKLVLPIKFPDVLPEVYVDRKVLSSKIPHMERSGKLCIGFGAILLDTDNPEGIVAETLARAANLVDAGISGKNSNDFLVEFARYWGSRVNIASICDSLGGAREIGVEILEGNGRLLPGKCDVLVGDDQGGVSKWLQNSGLKSKMARRGFFLPLQKAFVPPDFGEAWTIGQALEILQNHSAPADFGAFCRGLKFPVFIVLSLPQDNPEDRVLVGLQILSIPKAFRKKASQSLDELAVFNELEKRGGEPIDRIGIVRCDSRYLLSRGGASNRFLSSRVVIIGCGSVGSVIAEQLLMIGVGNIRLIDSDELTVDNVHRHALGMRSVNSKKAGALRSELQARFPHLTVDHRDADVEEVLRSDPAFVLKADLVVLATGDPTLELRLNDFFHSQHLKRIHAWVEPLGLGGHALAAGIHNGPGCFRCLFTTDTEDGLFNASSFAASGQDFAVMTGGCSGQFTPFSGLHAGRIATETTTLVAAVLSGEEANNVLISYRGDSGLFEAKYKLSKRASVFKSGEISREVRHAESECPTCHGKS